MANTPFAIIGTGWRAEFYMRIAKALPEHFTLTAVLERDKQRGEAFAAAHGVPVVHTLEELAASHPAFVAVAVRRGYASAEVIRLFEAGLPVLAETPPGETVEELEGLWNSCKALHGKIQVAEQYPMQPLYHAWEQVIKEGLLGTLQNINISSLHGYHGAAIIRRWLGEGMQDCAIFGKRYHFSVLDTIGREGLIENGELQTYKRDRLTLEFADGKIAFFDFADPAQYHSLIRTRQLTVQGERGEIDDLTVRYLNRDSLAVTQQLQRVDLGVYNNTEWSHLGLTLGERILYKSPLLGARLNDDEIAVASCMLGMVEYLATGQEFYPLAEALQDAYLSIKMEEALENPLQVVHTTRQIWAGE